jgi:hypothetical protein
VRTDRTGEVVDAPRPVLQQVGHAEFRGDMERLGQPVADDQATQSRPFRLVSGVQDSPRPRLPVMSDPRIRQLAMQSGAPPAGAVKHLHSPVGSSRSTLARPGSRS